MFVKIFDSVEASEMNFVEASEKISDSDKTSDPVKTSDSEETSDLSTISQISMEVPFTEVPMLLSSSMNATQFLPVDSSFKKKSFHNHRFGSSVKKSFHNHL